MLREVAGDRERLDAVIRDIAAHGVPNYFGEQRFGRHAANVERALAMFIGEKMRLSRERIAPAGHDHAPGLRAIGMSGGATHFYTSYLFPDGDKPRYYMGGSVLTVAVFLCGATAVVIRFYLCRLNKKIDRMGGHAESAVHAASGGTLAQKVAVTL